MTQVKIYAPEGQQGDPSATATRAEAGPLAGRKILGLDNGKAGAAILIARMGEQLARRTGSEWLGLRKKGSAATPCEDDLLDSIVAEADYVLTGTAD